LGYIVSGILLVVLPIPIGIAGIDSLPDVDLPVLSTLDNRLFNLGTVEIWWLLIPAAAYVVVSVYAGCFVVKKRATRWYKA
jgi:hypothetical protein